MDLGCMQPDKRLEIVKPCLINWPDGRPGNRKSANGIRPTDLPEACAERNVFRKSK